MNSYTLCGDCLEQLQAFADNKFDSIVTDPPYGLSFMNKTWDYEVPSVEIWKECLRVLKPGGHLLSFSSSRTYHRMVVNVEDAGFEIRDQIMWVYGSGFPKNHNIGKSVDKLLGNEREVVGKKTHARKGVAAAEERTTTGAGAYGEARTADVTIGTSEWEGWGTALKPSHEPIVLARKPISEKTVAANVLKWGTGGLNIDKSRVRSDDNPMKWETPRGGIWKTDSEADSQCVENTSGRFPANFIHDGSQLVLDLFPQTTSSKRSPKHNKKTEHTNTYTPAHSDYGDHNTYDDKGSAARFFYCAKANKKERNAGCDDLPDTGWKSHYCSSVAEDGIHNANGHGTVAGVSKNYHPTVKPIALMSYLINLITPPGGTVLDPFMGSGSTGCAAVKDNYSFVGIDLSEEFVSIANKRIHHYDQERATTDRTKH